MRPGPRPRGKQATALLDALRTRAGITIETGTVLATAAGAPHAAHTQEQHEQESRTAEPHVEEAQ